MDELTAKSEVLAAVEELVEKGLVARTWGNISCRIDSKRFAITPSGIGYDRLGPESIVVVDINTLEHSGNVEPSSEKRIHASAYELDSNANFVIHTHQTYASAVSVSGFEKLSATEGELNILGGKISKAKYGLPGTRKLNENVKSELHKGSSAILMEKHGALLTGTDRELAFKRAVTLEEVCKRAVVDIQFPNLTKAISSSRKDEHMPAYHGNFYNAYKEFNNIVQLNSPLIESIMDNTSKLEPMLDDFAQMIGNDSKVCSTPEDAVKAIKGRNCVFLKGVGAICCSSSEDDCKALLTLVHKNSLAYLNAKENGNVDTISWLDRKIMRFIYTNKYSKKK